jgi:hypothetical protein
MFDGDQASHLCHQPVCINPDHIIVEPKAANEKRKECRARGPIVKARVGETTIVLPPNGRCECAVQKCIPMIEWREAQTIE